MYDILSQFDLTHKEIEVFVLLIQYNKAAASTIAQQAHMSRTHAYELLQGLVKKGVCTTIKKSGTTYFQAISLDQLKTLAQQRYEKLTQAIDQLGLLQLAHQSDFDVTHYSGVEGLMSLYNDILQKPGDHIYSVLGADEMNPEFNNYITGPFLQHRLKQGITIQAILPTTLESTNFATQTQRTQGLESKLIDQSLFQFECEIVLYGNDKIIISLLDSDHLTGIRIQNSRLHHSLKSLFMLIWDKY